MNTIIDLMLAVRERNLIFYHKDTNQFDGLPLSEIELKNLKPNATLRSNDTNNFRFVSWEEVNHEDIMRFFVRECVEDKAIRKQLFGILSRYDFVDAYVDKLRELNLYDDFIDVCGDIYDQIFEEWADKNGLNFE